jgi:hypothetical protein
MGYPGAARALVRTSCTSPIDETTYAALQIIMEQARISSISDEFDVAVRQVDGWIDEVAKHYADEK